MRSFVFCAAAVSLLAACGLPGDPSSSTSEAVTVVHDRNGLTVTSGALTFRYPWSSGRWSLAAHGTTYVSGAYASVGIDGLGYVTSDSYPSRSLTWTQTVTDALGTGTQLFVDNVAPGRPTIRQQFTFYPGESFFTVEEQVWGGGTLSSNYMGALIVSEPGFVTAGGGSDPRVLEVPFDNDEWVRYDARQLGNTMFDGTGYEVGAVYENGGHHGVVVGSITHDFWKTGIYYRCNGGKLDRMNVWGGAATRDTTPQGGPTYGKDGTHDVAAHGKMVATVLRSPRIFVGAFDDWRFGLERFGWANGRIKPPLAWNSGAIFGWSTWGAFGSNVTASDIRAVSNALRTTLSGFSNQGSVYLNVDAGFDADGLVASIHANGQKVGTYLTPFTLFSGDPNGLARAVPNTPYTYGDIVLRDDNGAPIVRHRSKSYWGWVLDVTHPGTRQLITDGVNRKIAAGYDYVKLDFVTDGTLEGRHHDPTIATGIAAYNQAMTLVDELFASRPDIFIGLSIAPLFPGGYAHARRISCDVLGQIDDVMAPAYPHYGSTEYMLNSLTFGWWLSPSVYRYNDADEMALAHWYSDAAGARCTPGACGLYPASWARAHVTAAAITGGMLIDAGEYTEAASLQRSAQALSNASINAVAASARSFRPVGGDVAYVPPKGNAGSQASELFYSRPDAAHPETLLAAFNYGDTNPATHTIAFSKLGLSDSATYHVRNLSTGLDRGAQRGSLSVTIPAGDGMLYQISP